MQSCIVLYMKTMEITTAARRITRTLNAAPVGAWITFDADGHELGRVHSDNVSVHQGGAYVLSARYRVSRNHASQKWTHALVQDLMNEQAADR